jgi:hypothetical protein
MSQPTQNVLFALQVTLKKAWKGSDSLSFIQPAKMVGSGTIVCQDKDFYPRPICFLTDFSNKILVSISKFSHVIKDHRRSNDTNLA